MRGSRLKNTKGFSLVEIVLVLIIIGIIAVIAAPKVINTTDQAREAAIRKTVSDVRSAITMWRARELISGTTVLGWPPYGADTNGQDFMAALLLGAQMPGNPVHDYNRNIRNATGEAKGSIDGGPHGWAYDEDTGNFWANSNVMGENSW